MTLICHPFTRKLSAVPKTPATVRHLFGEPVVERAIILPTQPKPTKCCIGHGQSGRKLHRHFLACRPLCGRCVSRHRAFLRDQKAGR